MDNKGAVSASDLIASRIERSSGKVRHYGDCVGSGWTSDLKIGCRTLYLLAA
jgi:hypothetical protein